MESEQIISSQGRANYRVSFYFQNRQLDSEIHLHGLAFTGIGDYIKILSKKKLRNSKAGF